MNHAEQFAERCYAALEALLPADGSEVDKADALAVIAGCWMAFDAYLAQQPKRTAAAAHRAFVKPTLEQVTAYLKEIGYDIEPAAFFDFYQQNGWKVGRSAMKDWQSACRNWKRNRWGIAFQGTPLVRAQAASLGALQVELERVREQISAIVRPGGSAHARSASSVSPEEMRRYQELIARKESLEKRVREF